MKITKDLLRQWGACWTDDEIDAALARHGGPPTIAAVAADEAITLDDRLWVITQALAHLDESAARLYAIECAASVAHLAGDEDDQAVFLGVLNDLIAAEDLPPLQRDAARAAARAAARDAARDAARAAAWAAARAAARDAARAAAWDAARAAAWDAAWAAALKTHITRALEWLGEEATS